MKTRTLLLLLVISIFSSVSAQEADLSKMTPMIAGHIQTTSRVKSLDPSGAAVNCGGIIALVKLQDASQQEALTSRGCKILDSVGNIFVTVIPDNAIAELSLDERVVRMEANELLNLHTDSLAKSNNIIPIYEGTGMQQAYTGKGTVLGVVDLGFDFYHPMFLDKDGHTRIKQMWDIFTGEGKGYQQIGSLYTTEEQLRAVGGSSNSASRYHGTHVLGIAAGSPVMNGKYRGVAYDADIVLSNVYIRDVPQELINGLFNDINRSIKSGTYDPIWSNVLKDSIMASDAIYVLSVKSIMDYATAHNQPCVINCSFGGQMHLGTDYSLMNEILSALSGPGRIVVYSAGNESDTDLYRVKKQDETLDTPLWFNLNRSTEASIELLSDKPFTITFCPDVVDCPAITLSSSEIEVKSGQNNFSKIIAIGGNENNTYGVKNAYKVQTKDGSYAYTVDFSLPDYKNQPNKYKSPSASFKLEGEGEVQVIGSFDITGFTRFSSRPINSPYTVNYPSILDDVISVGAMSYRDSLVNLNQAKTTSVYNMNKAGKIVSWSGTGPTLSGKMKPDIAAAGYNIVSSYSSLLDSKKYYNDDQTYIEEIIDKFQQGDKDYYMLVESGTSMSAPVVSGVIALWLEADPTLTPARIKEIFAKTADHPEADLTYPNTRYGYGAIDAYKGLLEVLSIVAHIDDFPTHQPQQALITLSGKTLVLEGVSEAAVKIYTVSGTLVHDAATTDGTVNLSSLPAGIYAVRIDTADAATSGSTLIRL